MYLINKVKYLIKWAREARPEPAAVCAVQGALRGFSEEVTAEADLLWLRVLSHWRGRR